MDGSKHMRMFSSGPHELKSQGLLCLFKRLKLKRLNTVLVRWEGRSTASSQGNGNKDFGTIMFLWKKTAQKMNWLEGCYSREDTCLICSQSGFHPQHLNDCLSLPGVIPDCRARSKPCASPGVAPKPKPIKPIDLNVNLAPKHPQ